MRPGDRTETRQPDPLIAISRLPGCGGYAVALGTADRMGFGLFDRELLEEVARRSHMSVSRVRFLDERVRPMIDEMIESLVLPGCQSENYFRHLSRALRSIVERGRAVILGRGASFILPPKTCLRVLLVAPLKARIRNLAERTGLSIAQARDRICRVEEDRRAFIMKHFRRDMTDPTHYDIVLNTEEVGVCGAVDEVRMAWTMMRDRCLSAAAAGT